MNLKAFLGKGKKNPMNKMIGKFNMPKLDIFSRDLALSEAPYVTLYHGTTKENAAKIMKEGLKPRNEFNALSLTPSKSAALLHSYIGPEYKTGQWAHEVPRKDYRPGAIIKVKVPKESIKVVARSSGANISRGEIQKILTSPEGGKTLKNDIYEVQMLSTIPPQQLKMEDVRAFKQRAYSESRIPQNVGKDYNTIIWSGPIESRREWREGEAYPELIETLPPTRDIISKNMAFKHKYAFNPQNKNVKTVMMNPEEFLETTHKEGQLVPGSKYQSYDDYKKEVLHRSSIDWHKKAIPSKKLEVEIPYLEFDKWGRPIGHEGRHTSQAAVELGMKEIPVTIEQKRYSRDETPPYTFQKPFSDNVKTLLNLPAYKDQPIEQEYVYKGDYGIDEEQLEKEKKDYWEKTEREREERLRASRQRLRELEAESKLLEDSYTPEQKIQMMLLEAEIQK